MITRLPQPHRRDRRGVTLLELLLYLGISSAVVLGMTGFLVRATRQRVVTMDQTIAQQNGRTVSALFTHALRNAYDVTVQSAPLSAVISSENPDNPGQTIVTVFRYDETAKTIEYGQAVGSPPVVFIPLTDPSVAVENVSFERVSSALVLEARFTRGDRAASLASTIAFRQRLSP